MHGRLSFLTLASSNCRRWTPKHLSLPRDYTTISPENVGSETPPLSGSSPRNEFPYPSNRNPTPHQIFHISVGATQAEIKTRYYELVKTHHPDSHHADQLSPEIAHARFRAIQAAYDFLRGRTLSPHPNARPTPSPRNFDPYMHEMARRRRAYYASRGAYARGDEDGSESERWARPGWGEGFGAPINERTVWHEDGWRERLILALGVVTLLAGLFPSMPFTIASVITPSSFLTAASPEGGPSSIPDSDSTSGSESAASSPSSSSSFSIPFIDLDRGHREAVSALVQARTERQELGAERREGVRKRVQEMTAAEPAVESRSSSLNTGGAASAVPADPPDRKH
ncbi:hypothetical protein GALMADRAFT_241665 [Galerina marginata CBS 339.88]|uniref:J domain-containing protein n=1 Tax=Galerina marginata (strain CBS 339.88) TaxID=685588 RepID=A0A067TFC7_GALM3|nr:hypothetical protein GALMADRAFT_241665 [Galerina marginata CBS 339.88]